MKKTLYSFLVLALLLPSVIFAREANGEESGKNTPTPRVTTTTTEDEDVNETTTTATPTPSKTTTPKVTPKTSKESLEDSLKAYKEASEAKKLEKLKTFGTKAVDNRIKELNNIISQIEKNKMLESADKTELKTDIQKEIATLEALKEEITSATDLETLRTLIKKIYTDHKIYAVVKPKQLAILAAARTKGAVNKLENLEKRLEKLIDKAKDDGKDTTAVESYVTDFKAKTEQAKSLIDKAKATFKSMPINDPAKAKVLREEGKGYLTQAKDLLKQAGTDLKKIIAALKTEKKSSNSNTDDDDDTTPSPTPSATPTSTPTPTTTE